MSTYTSVASALILISFSPLANATDFSPSTHFYAIEYLKPAAGTGNVSVLNVTLGRPVEARSVERILREELQRAATLFPPKGDLLAYAWLHTDATLGSERKIALPDKSTFLIYSPKTRQSLTEKEYDLSQQKPAQPGKGIIVEMTLNLERGNDGRARIIGKTNLPDGMVLMIGLRDTASKYFAQDKREVRENQFVSEWFSDSGKPLRASTYQIEVSSPLPDFQPPAVRSRIGEKGENLSGSVRSSLGYKMVDYSVNLTLK